MLRWRYSDGSRRSRRGYRTSSLDCEGRADAVRWDLHRQVGRRTGASFPRNSTLGRALERRKIMDDIMCYACVWVCMNVNMHIIARFDIANAGTDININLNNNQNAGNPCENAILRLLHMRVRVLKHY